MMANYIEIHSEDNTDVLIVIDKIQYIIQDGDCCVVGLDNGDSIRTHAKFGDLRNAMKG